MRRRGAALSNQAHAEYVAACTDIHISWHNWNLNSPVLVQGPDVLLPAELWKNLVVVELFWFQNGRQQLWSCLRTYLTGWSGGETGDKRVA